MAFAGPHNHDALYQKKGVANNKVNLDPSINVPGGQITGANSVPFTQVRYRSVATTTNATAGVTSTVAHGCGVAPINVSVSIGNGYVTAIDATNVTVASTAASQALTLICMY
jgi:hypothetical protein